MTVGNDRTQTSVRVSKMCRRGRKRTLKRPRSPSLLPGTGKSLDECKRCLAAGSKGVAPVPLGVPLLPTCQSSSAEPVACGWRAVLVLDGDPCNVSSPLQMSG